MVGERKRSSSETCARPAKSSRLCVLDDKHDNFLKWCSENKFYLSPKVCVENERVCAQYGMVATEDISEGEVLFTIPRSSLISPATCSIAPLLVEAEEELGEDSGWVPLLLGLLYEYNNPQSAWRPYLDLVPDSDQLDLPMFWSQKEREDLLRGTGVDHSVNRDLQLLEEDFHTKALPFMQKHPQVFSPACQSLKLFTRMVAFVMAYSFYEKKDEEEEENSDDEEEESKRLPMMVPLADILNHVANNNAALTFEVDALHMKAVCDIKQGEEVFNTYGEVSNQGLLHMYGFAQIPADNHYDTVEIPVSVVTEVAQAEHRDAELLAAKLRFFEKMELHRSDESYVVGREGVLTGDDMHPVLKVLVMTAAEFKEHEEKEGWSDAESDDEDEDELLTFKKMPKLPTSWKKILYRCAEACLSRLCGDPQQDAKDMETQGKGLNPRARYSLFVRHGQRQLLKEMLEACR
ncbi:N-lysine methyltransferase setd6-like [Babylonia areolata]|uniref:N-lysine methyltransferase setd6-like n=1 Tax=Babylonia areolata TaxID=304850 RepID=UPI003FD0BB05